MSEARRDRLQRLFRVTRELVEDLDGGRPELLSVSDLNRALRQVLRNQVAILDALAALAAPEPAAPSASSSPGEVVAVRTFSADAELAPRNGHGRRAEPEEQGGGAPAAGGGSRAGVLVGETRELDPHLARVCVEQFDNRDQSYERGLEKLNRWTSGGTGGTPYQWRGDRAYLNLTEASPTGAKTYEEQLTQRMGFSRRLGRLVVPGLLGEIVVYERP